MTAIGALQILNVPIVIGDLLVIDRTGTGDHALVPTYAETARLLEGTSVRIAHMAQKTVIVHDRLCIAFSGHYDSIIAAINAVRRTPHPTNEEELRDRLSSIKTEAAYWAVGFVIARSPVCFRWSSSDQKLRSAAKNFAGTGASTLEKAVTFGDPRPQPEKDRILGVVERSITCCIAQLLYYEMRIGFGLREAFGGGYQIAIFDGKRFKFIPRYFLFYGYFEEKDGQWIPYIVEEYLHVANILETTIVRSFRIMSDDRLSITQCVIGDDDNVSKSKYNHQHLDLAEGQYIGIMTAVGRQKLSIICADQKCDYWSIREESSVSSNNNQVVLHRYLTEKFFENSAKNLEIPYQPD